LGAWAVLTGSSSVSRPLFLLRSIKTLKFSSKPGYFAKAPLPYKAFGVSTTVGAILSNS